MEGLAFLCLITLRWGLKWREASLLLHLTRGHQNVLGLENERHSILVLNDLECGSARKSMEVDVMD